MFYFLLLLAGCEATQLWNGSLALFRAAIDRVFVCCIGVALLSGCATLTGISPEYPQDWPPIASTAGEACPDLSGRYQNDGSYSFLWMTGSNWLAYRLGVGEKDADSVVLTYSTDTLRVEAFNHTGTIGARLLSQSDGDFSCAEGALILPTIVHKDADGTGGYRSESRLYLRPAQGGALIGEERSSGIGAVFWLVPIGGWQTFWFQWPQDK